MRNGFSITDSVSLNPRFVKYDTSNSIPQSGKAELRPRAWVLEWRSNIVASNLLYGYIPTFMNSHPLMQLSLEQLKQAIAIREQIEILENKLSLLLAGTSQVEAAPRQKKGMSAFGRARIAAAQKARWAKKKQTAKVGAPGTTSAPPKAKTKTMSPEARARIASAQKARWAKIKAGQKG
jgi:hypothetical protein